MVVAMSKLDEYLRDLVAEVSRDLPEVTTRRMFGSDAWFANAKIYALIWDGRIGLKMSRPERYQELLALEGSSTWSPMPQREAKPMSGWVLVTEAFHDDLDALRPWVESAHQQALSVSGKPVVKKKKAAKKKPAVNRSRPRARSSRRG
jgi:TfoX/Sxy family transcriptional regulator of competence genes